MRRAVIACMVGLAVGLMTFAALAEFFAASWLHASGLEVPVAVAAGLVAGMGCFAFLHRGKRAGGEDQRYR